MRAPSRRLLPIVLVAVVDCGVGDGVGTARSISLAASPTSISLRQGATGAVTITLARSGFDDPVNVSVTGLPAGVSTTVTPAQLTLTSLQAQVSVTVAETVEPGTYAANVSAIAPGVGSASATYSLVVTARPTFTLAANPSALAINQGASGSAEIQINRTHFTESVSLALRNPPAGISGQFTPGTGQNSVLTISADGSVVPGSYTVMVVGSANGQADQTATLDITVLPRPEFALSVSPGTLTLAVGSTGQATVTINRTNFTDAVSLALRNPPAGISGQFTPGTGQNSVLTISADGSVVTGSYTVTVVGSANGQADKTATLDITVLPRPEYALSVSPGTLTIASGSTGQATVSINRTNFTDAVALSLVNPHVGLTGAITPTAVTGNDAFLVVSVAATVATGTYTLTVRGTASGLTDRTATLTISVAPQPAYALSLPSGLTANAGATTPVHVSISRTNFTGVVSLSLANPPAGLTATFNPTSTSGTIATLAITVAGTVTPGPYTLTIVGTSAGYADRSTTTTITVQPRPDFTMSVSPTAVTLGAGSATIVTVHIHRTNFEGRVLVSRPTSPIPISPSGDLGFATGTSLETVLYVEVIAPGGTFPITFTGTGFGVSGTKTTTLSVTVVPLPPDFSLTVSPGTIGSHAGGGTMVFTVLVNRISFTEPVTLSVDPVPAGMSVQLNTPVVTGFQSLGSITIPPNTTPGTYAVTIRGTAPGMPLKTVTLGVIVTSDPPPDFSFSLGPPSTLNVSAGTSTSATVNIGRSTFTGVPITFTVESAPPGLTGAFNPVVATGSTTSFQLTVASSVLPGTYTMRLKGEALGGLTRTRDVTVVVPSPNAFSLSVAQPGGTIVQGGQQGFNISITRTNFTGAVSFSAENAPPGMTVTFNPNPSSGTLVFATVTVANSVPVGTYTITIRGTSPGQNDKTVTRQVNVVP